MKIFPVLIICVLFIFIMNSSCDVPQGGMYEDQKEYVEYQQPKLSPSEKEIKFINKLEDRGYKNIYVEIPGLHKYDPGKSSYKITLDCPFSFSNRNYDSIVQINEEIANELYSKVISNETIFECAEFQVKFNIKNDTNVFLIDWQKSELEENNGFRVIKTGNGEFKREKLKNKYP